MLQSRPLSFNSFFSSQMINKPIQKNSYCNRGCQSYNCKKHFYAPIKNIKDKSLRTICSKTLYLLTSVIPASVFYKVISYLFVCNVRNQTLIKSLSKDPTLRHSLLTRIVNRIQCFIQCNPRIDRQEGF